MAYVGRGIDNISNASLLDAITFTNSAGPYNLLQRVQRLSHPFHVQALVISVDGVIQASIFLYYFRGHDYFWRINGVNSHE